MQPAGRVARRRRGVAWRRLVGVETSVGDEYWPCMTATAAYRTWATATAAASWEAPCVQRACVLDGGEVQACVSLLNVWLMEFWAWRMNNFRNFNKS